MTKQFFFIAITAIVFSVTGSHAADYSSWSYYRDITLDPTVAAGITTAEANYPLLIRLSTAGGSGAGSFDFTQAMANGEDLRFTASDLSTDLPYEIDEWTGSPTAGTAAIWVQVNSISNAGNTVIRMYWGKPASAAATSGAAVFNSTTNSFKAVFHFNNSISNSTDISLTPVATGTADITAGAIIGGHARNFNSAQTPNTSSYIDLGSATADAGLQNSTTANTLGSWVFATSLTSGNNNWNVIMEHGTTNNQEHALRSTSTSSTNAQWAAGYYTGTNNFANATSTAFANMTGAWHYVAGTFTGGATGSTILLYVDGAQVATYTSTTTLTNPTSNWYLGRFGNATGRFWSGYLDEARIAGAVRSASWIKWDYQTQKAGQTCVVFGNVQSSATAPSALSYSINPATYTQGTAITDNTPTVTGTVTAYAVSPALPAGLALNTTTGVISGTPTTAIAAANYVVTASNGGGSTTATLSITVNAAAPANLTYSVNPATYVVGTAIVNNNPTTTGGTPTGYSVTPALPGGLTLSTTTGVISGTPTTAAGATGYIVSATNGTGSTTVTLTITVSAVVVAPANLAYSPNPAVYGVNVAIAANNPTYTGGAPTSFSVAPALPAGLTLNTTTGMVTGTPTTAQAAAAYVVTATNSAGSTSASLSIAVMTAPSGLTYSSNPVTYGVGAAITANTPTVTGTPTGYAVSPTLPAGLTLNASTGVISGTPTTAQASANYTVTATNAGGSTTATLSITVLVVPSGLTYSQPTSTDTVGRAIVPNTPTVTGTVTSYAVTPTLPAGLSISSTTGVISGTPITATAMTTYTVTAANAAGSTTSALNITVVAAVGVNRFAHAPGNFILKINRKSALAFNIPDGMQTAKFDLRDTRGVIIWSRQVDLRLSGAELVWDGIGSTGRHAVPGIYLVRMTLLGANKHGPQTVEKKMTYAP